MLHDFRFALRTLLKDRGFTMTAVLTLAVCIAANTATFAIVNSVLLRPLPVPDSQDIVLMSNRYPKAGAGDSTNSAAGDYFDRIRRSRPFRTRRCSTRIGPRSMCAARRNRSSP